MSVSLRDAALELAQIRVENGVDRIFAVARLLADVVEQRVPYGEEIIGAAAACLVVPQTVTSAVVDTIRPEPRH